METFCPTSSIEGKSSSACAFVCVFVLEVHLLEGCGYRVWLDGMCLEVCVFVPGEVVSKWDRCFDGGCLLSSCRSSTLLMVGVC